MIRAGVRPSKRRFDQDVSTRRVPSRRLARFSLPPQRRHGRLSGPFAARQIAPGASQADPAAHRAGLAVVRPRQPPPDRRNAVRGGAGGQAAGVAGDGLQHAAPVHRRRVAARNRGRRRARLFRHQSDPAPPFPHRGNGRAGRHPRSRHRDGAIAAAAEPAARSPESTSWCGCAARVRRPADRRR